MQQQSNPKRAWLITYGAASPGITHDMLREVKLIVDECHTLEQRDLKYTLINVPKRARHEYLVKCMLQLKEKYGIILQEIMGYESISGFHSPCQELRGHPGFCLMLENLPVVHKWLETGDVKTNKASLLHKFVAPDDLSSLGTKRLIQIIKEKTSELNDKKRKLEEAESENSMLEHQLVLKESENKELHKSVKHLKEQNSALKALYHAASS